MTENTTSGNALPPVELRFPRKSEREEMLAGKLYDVSDPELVTLRERAGDLCARFNALSRTDHAGRMAVLDELLPGHGEDLDVMGPVFFDYGCHTTIGDRVFANFNFTVLDCAPVTIGDDVLFGPNVSLLPPMHPLRWQDRNVRRRADGSAYDYEYGRPIVIGSNCWFGGNVTVLGGVTIGEGCVIGAGAVVTHDIPPHTVAVGNPAHVLRGITDADASALQEYAR
ncbi:sugar O-acetyltransferase [Bifidobacterium avesanii]|uniref:Sugar O-acetyltransferase n=1 Tax=Bifidobacterium avesanii TaxID=1798157 RepID=A0A7K3TI58_9BIFI|nr:sugar O-acetyltransferase [Bifidobacterium avesanii]KAB8291021.1 Acetyltransferase (isoleucine patch superfamily) [Bifidobacterium avesanii]NEG78788.1 sugar O-acetyltransferase [Bifidobacterium avesanii]